MTSARRAVYLDSSAIVKLAVREAESDVLRKYLRGRPLLVTSALARTEVVRALLPLGAESVARGSDVLRRLDIIRISDRLLRSAGTMLPLELRSLDAIHLATAAAVGADLVAVCTYDERMALAARGLGMKVVAPH